MLFRTQILLVPLLVVLLFGIGYRAEETATMEPPEPLDFSYTRLWKYAQQQCDLKGITQTEFTNSWLTVRRCLKDTLDVVQLNEDSMRMDASNQEVILTRHCPKLYEGVKCFDPFVELVRTCVDEESFEIFSSLRAWFRDILDFLCESNGTNFVYDKEKHDACTRDLNVHLITCAAENMNFIITPQLNRRNLSEEFCNMLTKAKDCLLGKLKPCDVFANGARLFYKNFIQITSCKATTDQH